MSTLYLLDMSGYLFRSYFAIHRMTNRAGLSTNALYGTVRGVLKLLEKESPEWVVAVFDGPDNKASRQALYPQYKGHRAACPEDLPHQMEWARAWCTKRGIPSLEVAGVEADDTIGAVAQWAMSAGHQVRICSSDKDLMQLVSDQVHLLHPGKDYQEIGPAEVQDLLGVTPAQVVDYLAIVGDTADNIPGVKGLGPKAAAALLQEYGTLESALGHLDQIGGRRAALLSEHAEQARLSQKLAQLQLEVAVPYELEAYRLGTPDPAALQSWYREMDFGSLLEVGDQALAPPASDLPAVEIITTPEQFEEMLTQLERVPEWCIDTETTSEDPFSASLVGLGITAEGCPLYYLPCLGELPWEWIGQRLQPLLDDRERRVYGHNLKYDLHILTRHGLRLCPMSFDTMVASYLLHAHDHRHSLDHLTRERYGYVKIPTKQLLGTGKAARTMAEVPVDEVARYCAEDLWCTARLRKDLGAELEERGLGRLFYELELPLTELLFRMETQGLFVDLATLEGARTTLVEEQQSLEQQIHRLAGHPFNLNSPRQLSNVLFTELGLPVSQKKSSGPSTSAAVLEGLRGEHPIVDLMLRWRQLEKLRSTYLDALPQHVQPSDGRIHTTFNQNMAATGRLSSHSPNMQNIPIRTPLGRQIREAFQPQQAGWSYLSADYSQIELRILAHLAEDATLIGAFLQGADIHQFTASLIHGIHLDQVTPAQRQAAKAINFGILYGQSPFGLSRHLGITVQAAKTFIDQYFARFPQVATYLQSSKERARAEQRTQTMLGRERLLPDIHSKNPVLRQAAERLAINSPVQGTAADIIKLAMLGCDRRMRAEGSRARMLLQIHDELLFEVPPDEVDAMTTLVREEMEGAVELKVPLPVEVAVGRNWGEC